jgi:hypothetical protein
VIAQKISTLHLKLVRHHSHAFVKKITDLISFQSGVTSGVTNPLILHWTISQQCHYKTVMTLEHLNAALNYFSALTFVNHMDGVTVW